MVEGGDSIEGLTGPVEFESVKGAMGKQGFAPASAEIGMLPSTTVPLEGKEAEAMLGMIDALEDLAAPDRGRQPFDDET